MREIRPSGSEGGARFYPLSLPLSARGTAFTPLQRQLHGDTEAG